MSDLDPFANERPLSFALREMQAHMGRPALWAALAATALAVTLAAPYGTGAMALLPRAAYWAVIVALTYTLGTFVSGLVAFRMRGKGRWQQVAVFALANGASVTLLIVLINLGLGFLRPESTGDLLGELAVLFAGAAAISAVMTGAPDKPAGSTAQGTPEAPAILRRLDPHQRGPLIALSAEDHYTRIRTEAGEALVLLRLGDAIDEAAPTEGLRVHRSHWVARQAVTGSTRTDGRLFLTMRHGPDIPVSRSYRDVVRDAGLGQSLPGLR